MEELLEHIVTTFGINRIYLLFGLILLVVMFSLLASYWIVSHLARHFKKTKTLWDDAFIYAVRRPLFLLILLLGLSSAFLSTNVIPNQSFEQLASSVRTAGIVLTFAWFLSRFIDAFQVNLIKRRREKNDPVDASTVEGLAKLCRLSVFVVAIIVILQTLGFSVSGILAFGGVGGIAVGFAAKDMLANFFGGLMIYLDRPFSVGDWVRSPDRSMEGIVENVGWRVTRVKNFQAVPLYIPNSTFSTVTIENVSRMTNRQIYETVGVRYDDAKVVQNIVDDVRSYLQSHAEVDQTRTLMVSLTTFGPSSLDFFIYCFSKSTAGVEFYALKQDILLKTLEIIEGHGAECAFPTTTLHVADMPTVTDNGHPNS